MIVIPAIDLKGGRCVRLRQGRMSEETVFSDRPEHMAKKWFELGAKRLHIVDLDGAVQGRPVNQGAIQSILEAAPIPVELGGGIRNMETLQAYMDLGVHFLVIGTAAHKNPDFVKEACEACPGRIILGIDARENRVALEGWTQEVPLTPVQLARRYEQMGPAAVIYTDIHRDGMQTGCNLEATRALAESIAIPVIASGGISGINDVQAILGLEEFGVIGMITGRALYEGTLNLHEAIALCEGAKRGNMA